MVDLNNTHGKIIQNGDLGHTDDQWIDLTESNAGKPFAYIINPFVISLRPKLETNGNSLLFANPRKQFSFRFSTFFHFFNYIYH